jgi:multiple sugar transport system ATP-binding protein
MADVKFDEVDKVYDNGVRAVDDLSLEIHDGEFLVLVGPSGCGKTTALRMVAGLEEISDGTLSIGGRVVNDLSPKERDIAMVFQNYALYPHLSVYDNIAFGLRLRKTSKSVIAERVAWAARMLDLTPYLERRPKQLSGGQRQRVAMGRAIVRQPQVFLMDEPLSNLDAKLRVQMRADIARLQRELGTTTVYVTHDQVEAMTMGDRVAVMSQGVLQQVDVPQRLYDVPANLFVAGFIGTPPMNLLEGTVFSDNGGVTLDLGGQRLPVPDAALSRYPQLRGAHGRGVVAGVRAGDLHRAAVRPDLPALTARLKLVEALGQESIAYFKIDAHVVTSGAEGIEEAVEEEAGSEGGVTADRPNLVVSLAPHETDQLRLEDEVPVAVNVAGMHFFDAETGEPLR